MSETPGRPLSDDEIGTDPAAPDGGVNSDPDLAPEGGSPLGQDSDGVDLGRDADTQDHGSGHDTDSAGGE